MKSASRMKQWLLLLLCVVMTAGVMVQAAGAAEPTKKCTNLVNEGVEYFSQITVMGSDISKWRQNVIVYATEQGKPNVVAGTVVGMDIEVTDDDTRYSCTISEAGAGNYGSPGSGKTEMSCNSIPVNAIINGVYFIYKPNSTPPGTPITFMVEERTYDPSKPGAGLHGTSATVQLPTYPCARNLTLRDFEAAKDKSLVLYSEKDCNDKDLKNQTLDFYEKYEHSKKYAIVNIMYGDYIVGERIRVNISPEVDFDYELTLTFGYDYNVSKKEYDKKVSVKYIYDPLSTPKGQMDAASLAAVTALMLDNDDLPLVLLGGNISKVNAKGRLKNDDWGKLAFPTSESFDVRFWYENESGTLGYENSVFHFERDLNIKFAYTCKDTAVSTGLYDPCAQTTQGFWAKLPNSINVSAMVAGGKKLYYGRDGASLTSLPKQQTDPVNSNGSKRTREFWFMTWKCLDSACDWTTSTGAYPYQIVMSDGGGSNRTYTNTGGGAGASSMTRFTMLPYYDTGRPFALKEVSFAAPEPGTYVIYAFVDYKNAHSLTALKEGTHYLTKFYVTVNETDEILTCYSRANNGYFKAWWNDCLSPSETQLIPFEHIPNTEEAWMVNHSAYPVDYPFIAEYSYLPQKLEVASLNCKFEAIDGGGRPGEGYCNHYNVHVPPHTKVTITGGTMYMSGYPEHDEYRAAYVREDLVSISHLIFSIGVEQCENKKIPDTGLSLRSPMSPLKVNAKVNESVDPATGFVFTGNSLRIPAIGLGMETPIPIVHVYYENGSNNMVWDLSTLGNYVGELEGGSYIPYGGNSVLTGHFWSGGVFKNLEGLNYEDEIIIFANDGFKYTYQVVQKFIAQPEEVYEMFQQIGERSLTLVTCENYNLVTNEYERRYIVRASIKNVEPYVENW